MLPCLPTALQIKPHFSRQPVRFLGFGHYPVPQPHLQPSVHQFQNQADLVPQTQFMHLLWLTRSHLVPSCSVVSPASAFASSSNPAASVSFGLRSSLQHHLHQVCQDPTFGFNPVWGRLWLFHAQIKHHVQGMGSGSPVASRRCQITVPRGVNELMTRRGDKAADSELFQRMEAHVAYGCATPHDLALCCISLQAGASSETHHHVFPTFSTSLPLPPHSYCPGITSL